MDTHSMNRKGFLKLTFTLIGGATVAAGCSSSNSNGGAGGSSGTGGSTGTGGSSTDAKVDTGPAIMCADPLATSQLADSTGHMHMLFVPLSALSMTSDQTELTTGFPMDSSGHFHQVTLSVADLATLKGGGSVTKTSNMAGDPPHSHMYMVSCHGD
jgi:hypothetical protein